MTETQESVKTNQRKKQMKWIVMIAFVLLGAGGAFAYTLWPISDKAAYFKAEVDTIDFFKEQFEDRFENELAWSKINEEKPTATTFDFSVEYRDAYDLGSFNEIEEMINQSNVTLYVESNMNDRELFSDISANIAGISLEDFLFYISEEQLLIDLPFLEDTLRVKNEDLDNFLYQLDPYTFDQPDKIDLSDIFDFMEYTISEEDREYIRKKYSKFFFDAFPDEAFSKEKETIDVGDDSLDAEKITFYLTEEDVKLIYKSFLENVQSDDRIDEIIKSYLKATSFVSEFEIDRFLGDLEEGLDETIRNIDQIELPEGLKSVIWIDKGLIVQREFSMVVYGDFGEEIKLTIKGVHDYQKDGQRLDYTFTTDSGFETSEFTIDAELHHDGKTIDDSISLVADEVEISYVAEEDINGSTQEFERGLKIYDHYWEEETGFFWSGESNFEKDSYQSTNRFFLENDDLGQDIFHLNVDIESKEIRQVEAPSMEENIKDIGQMSEEELDNYIYFEVQIQLLNWIKDKFGVPVF